MTAIRVLKNKYRIIQKATNSFEIQIFRGFFWKNWKPLEVHPIEGFTRSHSTKDSALDALNSILNDELVAGKVVHERWG